MSMEARYSSARLFFVRLSAKFCISMWHACVLILTRLWTIYLVKYITTLESLWNHWTYAECHTKRNHLWDGDKTWRHYNSTKFVCHATEVIEALDRKSHSRLYTVQIMCGQKIGPQPNFNAQWVRQFGDAEFGPNFAGCRGTGTRTAKNSMGASSLWSFGPKPRFVAICSVWLSNTWYIIAPFRGFF